MRSRNAWLNGAVAVALLAAACEPPRDHSARLLQFGTVVTINAYGTTAVEFDAAVADLEGYFRTIGRDWYPWADGELERVNAAIADGRKIDVSPELQAIIEAAAEFEIRTGGRFNAGLGRLAELWGFHDLPSAPEHRPAAVDIDTIIAGRPGAASLEWDGTILLSGNPVTMLDLGGIAKGAIVRESLRQLERHGIMNAIVNLGGDLAVSGSVRGRDARIGIRSPQGEAPVAGLIVRSGEAVFTSGNYERYVVIDGVRYPHVLDPRTGEPVTHTASVTVVHDDPVMADAAATALLVGGIDEFPMLAGSLGLDFAMIIDASGDLRLTPGMRERLHWREAGNDQ